MIRVAVVRMADGLAERMICYTVRTLACRIVGLPHRGFSWRPPEGGVNSPLAFVICPAARSMG